MDFQDILKRNRQIHKLYIQSDIRRLGHEWSRGEYTRALAADVGALIKYTMAKDGLREVEDLDQKIKHEIGDILSCLIFIADKYEVDIEKAYFETMDELEKRSQKVTLAKSHSL